MLQLLLQVSIQARYLDAIHWPTRCSIEQQFQQQPLPLAALVNMALLPPFEQTPVQVPSSHIN